MRIGEEVRGDPRAPRLVISGTGRSGTTFLVRLLTALGLDTGYVPDGGWYRDDVCGGAGSGDRLGGLERHPRATFSAEALGALPYVVKDPRLCHALGPLLDAGTFRAARVLVPVRDLRAAAVSRVSRDLLWLPDPAPGDPDRERRLRPGEDALRAQETALAAALGTLVSTCATRGIPTTVVPFDTVASGGTRLMDLLWPVLPKDLSVDDFCAAYRSCRAGLS